MDNAKTNLPPPAPETKLHFLDYWRIIRVRKTVILTVFLLVVITATMVTNFLPVLYASTARIEVQKDTPDVEGLDVRQVSTAWSFDPYWMATQFEILQSSEILNRVIKKLKLQERFAERDKMPAPYRPDEAFLLLKRLLSCSQYRNTSLIEIKVYSTKPQEAAEIANEIAEAYRLWRQETRTETAQKGIKSLQEELDDKENEYRRLYTNVDSLRKELELNLIDPHSGRSFETLDQDALRRLDMLRQEAQSDLVQLDTLYKELKGKSREELKKSAARAQQDTLLTDLLTKQAEAEHKLALLEPDYSADHPEVQRINKLLETLNRQVNDSLDGILSGLQVRVQAFAARAQQYSNIVEAAKLKERLAAEKMRPYTAAKDELDLARQVKNALSLRVASTTLDYLKISASVVRLVDRAEISEVPVRPHKTLHIVLGVVVGLVLGIGLAFFIEYLDTSVKTIDEVERALQAPVLGVIPQNVGNLLEEGPECPHAEAYRVLRTNMLFSCKDEHWNSLTIVSGGAGEGKSTTLFNLAVVFAQNGLRVLLVDSDLRRPSLHKMLGISNSVGLTSFLLKQKKLEEVIQTTQMPLLDFMPSGKLPSSALGVLNSAQMKEMIGDLKQRYDFVFFDSPPIMGISDASILASQVDMTLQVVQYRRYPQPMTTRAKQMIEKVGGNLIGIVLNNINMSQDSYYYYYSGYFEESYYKQEGEPSAKPERGRKHPQPEVAEVEIKQKY